MFVLSCEVTNELCCFRSRVKAKNVSHVLQLPVSAECVLGLHDSRWSGNVSRRQCESHMITSFCCCQMALRCVWLICIHDNPGASVATHY